MGNLRRRAGADALRVNWLTAVQRYQRLGLPKALVLKVPQHGALNSLDVRSQSPEKDYLDICIHSDAQRCCSILFAGDVDHPDARVYERLQRRTDAHCLANGLKPTFTAPDLGIELEGVASNWRRHTLPAGNKRCARSDGEACRKGCQLLRLLWSLRCRRHTETESEDYAPKDHRRDLGAN